MSVSDFERAFNMFKPRKAMVVATQDGAVRVRLQTDGSEPVSWYPSLELETPVGDAGVLLQVNSEEYVFVPDNLPLAKTPNIYELRRRMDAVITEDIPNAVGPEVADKVSDLLPAEVTNQLGSALAPAVTAEVGAQVPTAVTAEVTAQVVPAVTAAIDAEPRVAAIQGDVSTLKLGVTRKNLRSEGFALDGSDESPTVASMIAADSPGTVYVIPDGATLGMGSTQLLINGKPHTHIEGVEGAKIQWTSVSANPLLLAQNSEGFVLDNVDLVGAEMSFINTNNNRFAAQLHTCPGGQVRNVKASGTSRGLNIYNSHNAEVDGFEYTGFVDLLDPEPSLVNHHTTVMVVGSNDTRMDRITGRNCGSALLIMDDCHRGVSNELLAENTRDNGIYQGAGTGWRHFGPTIINDSIVLGTTGIKLRGSGNIVMGGRIENLAGGYVLTPGDTDIGDGYGGAGNAVIASSAYNIGGTAMTIEAQGAMMKGRDFLVALCNFDKTGTLVGGNSAVRVANGNYHRFLYNTVTDHRATGPAYTAAGVSGDPLVGLEFIGEKIRDVSGAASAQGFFTSNVDGIVMDGMTLRNISAAGWGIILTATNNARITRTRVVGVAGTTSNIRINDAASTGNWLYDNPMATINDQGTGTVKWGNANGNPTVAANATDLATAIALVNDIKAKLQAQKRFG